MSRPIKFRGKRLDNGGWVYGNLVTYNNKPAIQDYYQSNGEIFLVDPETVGQYTGLRDSKRTEEYPEGQEIYEGDIVRYQDAYDTSSECGYDWEETLSVGVIEWYDEEAKFDVTNRESIGLEEFWEDIDQAEVIGNASEHPHSLEQKESAAE
ncbi:YopX family protein [Paenibacillus chitinolyticus]|uniref:YopX family protein n=1 Tax=Paenibacillus chitinolyticus TaxID=79263 RepID=UPI00367020F9